MPTEPFAPWRADLYWSRCMVCNEPTLAGFEPAFQTGPEICYQCTGYHPHIPASALQGRALADYFDEVAEKMPNNKLCAHYHALANLERARPPLTNHVMPVIDLDLDDIDL